MSVWQHRTALSLTLVTHLQDKNILHREQAHSKRHQSTITPCNTSEHHHPVQHQPATSASSSEHFRCLAPGLMTLIQWLTVTACSPAPAPPRPSIDRPLGLPGRPHRRCAVATMKWLAVGVILVLVWWISKEIARALAPGVRLGRCGQIVPLHGSQCPAWTNKPCCNPLFRRQFQHDERNASQPHQSYRLVR